MQLDGNHYEIQGINPIALCEKYGTPLYVYDAQVIENQYNKLKSAFGDIKSLRINFAMTASVSKH